MKFSNHTTFDVIELLKKKRRLFRLFEIHDPNNRTLQRNPCAAIKRIPQPSPSTFANNDTQCESIVDGEGDTLVAETLSDLQPYLKVNITNLDTMELNVIHRQRLQMAKVKGNNKLRESN